jgi:O-antigen ligase
MEDSFRGVAGHRGVNLPAARGRAPWPVLPAQWFAVLLLRPLHALLSGTSLLFLATLLVMLFRPPDLELHSLDRFAFVLLVFIVLLKVLLRHDPLRIAGRVTWPMLGLVLLGLAAALSRPYEPQVWSVFAAKWLVPFALFHLAGFVFEDAASLRRLEVFSWIVLVYLSAVSILFLADTTSLIFPRYIMDASIGIHADRARGPFLQAVANGVTLNLLALIALDSFRRKRLPGILAASLFVGVPLAILATKTRAVWLSFALSLLVLMVSSPSRRIRVACLCLLLAGTIGLAAILSNDGEHRSLNERLEEASPVEFRMALYQAGWEMFTQHPVMGWPSSEIQPELEKRINEFHQEAFYFHNTFLEVAVAYGSVGLFLYLWVIFDLLRLGKRFASNTVHSVRDHFCDLGFRSLWPLIVAVYLLNACFVVMNYQFVNGLLFTFAGILSAQDRRVKSGLPALAG